MVADLWQRKGKISDRSKTGNSIVLQQWQNKVRFRRNGSSFVSKFLLNLVKGQQCFLFIRENFLPFKRCSENFNAMLEPRTVLYFDIAREQ